MVSLEQVTALQNRITDEVFHALGLKKDGPLRRALGGLVARPTRRFASIFAAADEEIARGGIPGGSRSLLPEFNIDLQAQGAEALPAQGPLLIVSNHPGAYDSICLASCLPRADLKIIVWEVPFYRAMCNADRWFIYTHADPAVRIESLRQGIRHLLSGGSLLLFATATIDPDPAVLPGASDEIGKWSASIEAFLRNVPNLQTCLAIASGVIERRFANHPLTRIHRGALERRWLAEVLQILSQLARPNTIRPHVRVSFTPPVTAAELAQQSQDPRRLLSAITARGVELLQQHMHSWYRSQNLAP
ncbi:MAG: hypothetical protein JW987_03685 [Anaerolineaceae bacterium]|nr:hypothetical protein [Anaerolineaceae bacterium]